ncbi:DMT family transporter [Sulfitobacter sp. TSTF-M16]|uniref:DMT family transporter n=1 Tax=Sulfitobacter aestuariivivens TaxID=2766981 RepID=A0A927D5X1_9RHOB|nr:DMT family transporter [Sulfitobacter aestuariivivens]MBD3664813.1 DMT family transporter [Sulfitobacter aestuariivivens]
MIQPNNPRLGIILMITATLIFAVQDGLSRYLAETYNVMMVVMVRYWFFAAFVIAIAARSPGGFWAAIRTDQPLLQAIRGLVLAAEICVSVIAYVVLGLIATHAIFACYPLLVAALSGPVLGEKVGWRRWLAIGIGFCGILVILQPGLSVFDPAGIIAFVAAALFAVYAIMTRFAARQDSAATSFFWTGATGAVATSCAGAWFWEPLASADWSIMLALCLSGVAGHWLMIRSYEVAEATAVQPIAYFHLVFIAIIGVSVFEETIAPHLFIGAAIVVFAGLFTLWRESLQR